METKESATRSDGFSLGNLGVTFRRTTALAPLIIALFLAVPAYSQTRIAAQPRLLSESLLKATPTADQEHFLAVLTDRPLTRRIRSSRIDARALQLGTVDTLLLNFFEDATFLAQRSRTERKSREEFTWFGHLMEREGWVVLVVKGGRVTGSLHTLYDSYALVPVGGELHAVLEIDQGSFPPDHEPAVPTIPASESETTPVTTAGDADLAEVADLECDNPLEHDADSSRRSTSFNKSCRPIVTVLVAFTSNAANLVWDIDGVIERAVDEANDTFVQSEVDLRMQLVSTVELDYQESGKLTQDLRRLRKTGDGFMDEVHVLRDQLEADMVFLVVDNNAKFCGQAANIRANPRQAFAVVRFDCMMPGVFTFAHEAGHLFGARHDPVHDPNPVPFRYGHGFRHRDWRTVMAYNCSGDGCPRIPHWSNPRVRFMGDKTGTATFNDNSRVLSTTAPELAAFRAPCAYSGDEGRLSRLLRGRPVKLYEARPGELFVVVNDRTLLKLRGSGGSGQNMFGLRTSGVDYVSEPGFDHLIGSQVFPAGIRDVLVYEGFTFVALADGRIVKVQGTGGTGRNMFALKSAVGGFEGLPGYPYYVGSHRFSSPVRLLVSAPGVLLLAFDNGRMLKIRGAGGSGFNLFAIRDTGKSFESLPGYPYYLGDQSFGAPVSAILVRDGETVLGLENGKLLKAQGSGGTGHNMFAVAETNNGFNGLPGYPYYLGDSRFRTPAIHLAMIGSDLLLSFTDGRILKVAGTGGTGHNMFAVRETRGGFEGLFGYPYYLGDQGFSAPVKDILQVGSQTLVALADGHLLKVSGSGGTGHNMFAVTYASRGFVTVPGYDYLRGSSAFGSGVVGLFQQDGFVFASLANGKVLKARGSGGSGFNLFAVTQTKTGFLGRCCYDYWVGSF